MGDHGLFGKQNLYEFGGMHVPLVVADKIRQDSGKHFTNWDSNKYDLVTLEEFRLGQKGKEGLEAQFKSYDKNTDGKPSPEEYVDPRAKRSLKHSVS